MEISEVNELLRGIKDELGEGSPPGAWVKKLPKNWVARIAGVSEVDVEPHKTTAASGEMFKVSLHGKNVGLLFKKDGVWTAGHAHGGIKKKFKGAKGKEKALKELLKASPNAIIRRDGR